jgi:hypothetical protein
MDQIQIKEEKLGWEEDKTEIGRKSGQWQRKMQTERERERVCKTETGKEQMR